MFEERIQAFKMRCAADARAGLRRTEVAGIALFWATMSSPAAPLVYEAGIVVLLGGRKHGTIGQSHFVYAAGHYLVLTLPLPLKCAHEATFEEPLFGFFVEIDREDLAILLAQITEFGSIRPNVDENVIAPASIDEAMYSAIHRLIAIIDDPMAGRVIGPALRREILFYALRGPRGSALAALARQSGDEGCLDSVIRSIRRDVAFPVTVEQMARKAGMSISVFHRAFRAKTGQSPLQYVKRLRLHKARDLINFEGLKVGEAARRVGYESNSQFSREYKKYFGTNASDRQVAFDA
jgi:AraC-like DNA-binding protein